MEKEEVKEAEEIKTEAANEAAEVTEEAEETVAEEKPLSKEDIIEIVKSTIREVMAEKETSEEETVENACDKDLTSKEEVIKLEALNSAPKSAIGIAVKEEPSWKSMSQADFCKWIDSGSYLK